MLNRWSSRYSNMLKTFFKGAVLSIQNMNIAVNNYFLCKNVNIYWSNGALSKECNHTQSFDSGSGSECMLVLVSAL